MKATLNEIEKKVLSAIQHGMPFSRKPYEDLAADIGITSEQLLGLLRKWKSEKKIRRLGAIVNHFQMGHGFGAMVVWRVPENRIKEVGNLFALFGNVSHAYQRPTSKQWPYALYTMVHASSSDELEQTLAAMSHQSGIREFHALKTVRELKKVPPTYILD